MGHGHHQPVRAGRRPRAAIAAFLDALEARSADRTARADHPAPRAPDRRGLLGAAHGATGSRLVYSLSKTFTGTALGLQLGEGRLSLDDLVSEHLPELFDGRRSARRGG